VEYLVHKDGFSASGDDSELALFLPRSFLSAGIDLQKALISSFCFRGNSIINVFKLEVVRLEKAQPALYQLVETCLSHLDSGEFITANDVLEKYYLELEFRLENTGLERGSYKV
jgi:hypothetical protein